MRIRVYVGEKTKEKIPSGLERPNDGVLLSSVRDIGSKEKSLAIFISQESRDIFPRMIKEYWRGLVTEKGNPTNKGFFNKIEGFHAVKFEDFCIDDPEDLPKASDDEI